MATKKSKKSSRVVLPGDPVDMGAADAAKRIRLGPGLRQDALQDGATEPRVLASKCGVLKSDKNAFWVDASQKRVRCTCLFGLPVDLPFALSSRLLTCKSNSAG